MADPETCSLNQMFREESRQKLVKSKNSSNAHCRRRDLILSFCDLILLYKINC